MLLYWTEYPKIQVQYEAGEDTIYLTYTLQYIHLSPNKSLRESKLKIALFMVSVTHLAGVRSCDFRVSGQCCPCERILCIKGLDYYNSHDLSVMLGIIICIRKSV